jgi:hypothetical protein
MQTEQQFMLRIPPPKRQPLPLRVVIATGDAFPLDFNCRPYASQIIIESQKRRRRFGMTGIVQAAVPGERVGTRLKAASTVLRASAAALP